MSVNKKKLEDLPEPVKKLWIAWKLKRGANDLNSNSGLNWLAYLSSKNIEGAYSIIYMVSTELSISYMHKLEYFFLNSLILIVWLIDSATLYLTVYFAFSYLGFYFISFKNI